MSNDWNLGQPSCPVKKRRFKELSTKKVCAFLAHFSGHVRVRKTLIGTSIKSNIWNEFSQGIQGGGSGLAERFRCRQSMVLCANACKCNQFNDDGRLLCDSGKHVTAVVNIAIFTQVEWLATTNSLLDKGRFLVVCVPLLRKRKRRSHIWGSRFFIGGSSVFFSWEIWDLLLHICFRPSADGEEIA